MSLNRHSWKIGLHGRAIQSQPGGHFSATLECQCGTRTEKRFRELAGPDQIDRKFAQAGWSLDPPACPECQARRKQEKKTVATKASPTAIKAQVAMMRLLNDHFDADGGAFTGGYDDDRIAKETGLAVEAVREYRIAGFGELKEPPEVASIHADVQALEKLFLETIAPLQQELAALKARVAEVRRKFAA